MPYPPEHKAQTRARIVASARALFNRHGFDQVTIDQVMARAGLTRGGFYHHFASKDELYTEAVASASSCSPFAREIARGAVRDRAELAHLLVDMYLADEMLRAIDDQCPLYALSTDVSRAGRRPREAYSRIVERMASVFGGAAREPERALAAVALCVGGMVLARTTHDPALAKTVRIAARASAHALLSERKRSTSRRRRRAAPP